MYFTELPDHNQPEFDEQAHFSRFSKYNIIFNAESSNGFCDKHVGCLSFKTILRGGEIYRFGHQQVAVRPGEFLMLNNEQEYGCRTEHAESKMVSVFFEKNFAASVFYNASRNLTHLLDNAGYTDNKMPAFFQTLNPMDNQIQVQLTHLISSLNSTTNNRWLIDEQLVFLLEHLIGLQQNHLRRIENVYGSKASTRKEVYKRVCIAKDYLHYTYHTNPNLTEVSRAACLSVPQLVRQFKAVFGDH